MANEDIAQSRNVRILKMLGMPDNGRKVMIRCPFHNERTPSFVIFPDNGFKCFGCGVHGQGAIDFVMKLGCDFKQAVEELKKYL
jgi:DNA primase